MDHATYMLLLSFVFGTMVGSFANVCIYRLPLALNLVTPPSRCITCGTVISWYENIPVISFLIQRARCRHCGIFIGWIHIVIEVASGLLLAYAYQSFGLHPMTLYFFLMGMTLIVLSMIDFEHRIIPDVISIGGMLVGLGCSALFEFAKIPWHVTMIDSILGTIAGAGFLWAVAWTYEKVTGTEGMGFGDVKLLGFFGAHAGIKGAFASIFIGSLVGSAIGLLLMLFFRGSRKTVLPFGPFLSLGFIVYMLHHLGLISIDMPWIFGPAKF